MQMENYFIKILIIVKTEKTRLAIPFVVKNAWFNLDKSFSFTRRC